MTDQDSRALVEADLEGVFELINLCGVSGGLGWTGWRDFIQWAAIDNPYRQGRALGHVIRRQGRCLAAMIYVHVPLRLGQWSGISMIPSFISVHPETRGVLGVRLVDRYLADEAVEAVISPHASRFAAAMLERHGSLSCAHSDANAVGTLSLRRRIDNAAARQNALLGAVSRAGVGGLAQLGLRLQGRREVRPPPPVLGLQEPYDLAGAETRELDRLCETAIAGLDLAIARDAAFMRWRYVEPPHGGQYRALALSRPEGGPAGLAVLQRRPGSPNVVVCELLCDPGVTGIRGQLIAAALRAARRWGGAILESRVVAGEFLDDWQRAGLEVRRKPHPQFWVSPKPHLRPPAAIRGMYAGGDHKLF